MILGDIQRSAAAGGFQPVASLLCQRIDAYSSQRERKNIRTPGLYRIPNLPVKREIRLILCQRFLTFGRNLCYSSPDF
jgi:hypothetical protein